MAASSSAKFFVHQNQNKANLNSSSAAYTFAAESESIEFPSSSNVYENAEKLTHYERNADNNEIDRNYKSIRSNTNDLERQPQQQARLPSGAPAIPAPIAPSTGTAPLATNEQIAFVDIEESIEASAIISSSVRQSQLQQGLFPKSCDTGGKVIINQTTLWDQRKLKKGEINNNQFIRKSTDDQEISTTLTAHSTTSESKSNNDAPITFVYQMRNTAEQAPGAQRQPQPQQPPATRNVSLLQQYQAPHQQQQQQQQQRHQPPPQSPRTPTTATIINSRAPHIFSMNSGQPTQAAPGNRITFTSQMLPNGTINIGGGHPGGGSTIISTSQLPNTTTIKTISSSVAGGGAHGQHHGLTQQVQHNQVLQQGQGGQHSQQQQNAQSVGATQTQTLVIKSNHAVSLPAGLVSSAPGIVTMTKTINQGNQPLLNSMIPASVVVGMRPPGTQQQQKNVQGNTLGRVVIGGPHMVGARPQSPAITLSALTPGQTPALILKTENGFQLLRVGTATSSPQTIGTNSTNPTQIRLQTVPAASMAVTSSPNNIVVNSVASTNSSPHVVYTSQANISLQQQSSNVASIAGIQQHQQHHHQQQQQQQIHQQTQHLHSQPQITQIQTISPQQTPSHQQQQQQHHQQNATAMNNSNVSSGIGAVTTTTTQSTAAQGNTKEKCRKFLANLIDLSTREPKPVEKNVRNLIQELVNANVEPEEFCDRLERLLNASPQPCLIGFLKKSLPLLRQALFTKELVIEGIKPPPQHVVGMTTLQQQLPKIQAQIRPISQNQTTTIGQTQVRMISPAASGQRPITITKQPAGLRIQGPTNGPRLVNAQIRGPIPVTLQQQQHMNSPQLQTQANIVQIRAPNATQINRPATVQIRTAKPKNPTAGITHVKVGQTQIKAISSSAPTLVTTNQPPSLAAISNNIPNASSTLSTSSSILSTINSVASNSFGPGHGGGSGNTLLPMPSLPTVHLPPAAAAISNAIDVKADSIIKFEKATPAIIATTPTIINRSSSAKSAAAAASKASNKKKKDQQDKEKDEKSGTSGSAATAALSSFFQQPSISMSSSLYGDDDINDVAAMGGVNLAEESQRILGCTENIGTQIRSCKDEVFLHLPALQARIRAMVAERGLEEPSQDVAVLISHACQERLKSVVEKLAVIAEHRIDVIKLDPRYEVTKDVRGQIKFLEELDKAEQKRHEEMEREMLLRAAKSRSKIEDPEQAKMKARAKEMQRAEMEELRQRDANMTALQAIGPRKKLKLDSDSTSTGVSTGASGVPGATGTAPAPLRPRIKRVNLRDMLFFMEQERETCRSQMLYKAYLK